MTTPPIVVRALQVAEMRLGTEAVADGLGVSAEQVTLWRMDREPMPHDEFLALASILADLVS
jgi:hypothetical protein